MCGQKLWTVLENWVEKLELYTGWQRVGRPIHKLWG